MKEGRKNKWVLISTSVILVMFFVTTIFIVVSTVQKSQEKSKQLSEKYEVLLDNYEKLLEERNQLQQSMDEKVYEGEQLGQEIEEKQQIIDKLKYEIDRLEDEIKELTKELEVIGSSMNSNRDESDVGIQDNKKDQKTNDTDIQEQKEQTKKVFLTFDDGLSANTPAILDILGKENVPASFFVIGTEMEKYPSIVQRAYQEGHMILPHSYSHDYAIYTSFETFYDDLATIEQVYEDVLKVKPPKIFRFPGGSSNHSSFNYGGKQFMPMLTVDVKQKNYTYVDWNVSSGDTGSNRNNPNKMLDEIIKQSEGKDFIVLLFHDTGPNDGTVQVLPEVIKYYRENGYTFRSFRDITNEELKEMENRKITNKPIVR